jgi:hypothetical protein
VTELPQFRLDWKDVASISPAAVTGRSEAESALPSARRPMVLFLHDADTEGARDGVDAPAFRDERVAILARFFDLLRMDLESAADDRALSAVSNGRQSRLVFLRPNYTVASVLTGKWDAGKVADSMAKTLRADFANSPDAVLKGQAECNRERSALESDRAKYLKLKEQADAERSASRREKLLKDADALQQALLASEERIDARERALYELKPKATAKS